MPLQITKVTNLKTGAAITHAAFTINKKGNAYEVSEIPKADVTGLTGVDIQVEFNDSAKPSAKLIAGNGKIDDTGAKAKLVDLKEGKKTKLKFQGTVVIKAPEATIDDCAAKLNVSIGNWNRDQDWILNMSERVNGANSSLNVSALMKWVNGNGGNSQLALPEGPNKGGDTDAKQLDDLEKFVVEFNSLYFNLSQGDYDIDLETQKGSTLTILDKFVLSDIKFRMTNMDINFEE